MTMPERIWAKVHHEDSICGYWEDRPIRPNNPENVGTEYIRAEALETEKRAEYERGVRDSEDAIEREARREKAIGGQRFRYALLDNVVPALRNLIDRTQHQGKEAESGASEGMTPSAQEAARVDGLREAAILFRHPEVFSDFFDATELPDTPENRKMVDVAFKTVARRALASTGEGE